LIYVSTQNYVGADWSWRWACWRHHLMLSSSLPGRRETRREGRSRPGVALLRDRWLLVGIARRRRRIPPDCPCSECCESSLIHLGRLHRKSPLVARTPGYAREMAGLTDLARADPSYTITQLPRRYTAHRGPRAGCSPIGLDNDGTRPSERQLLTWRLGTAIVEHCRRNRIRWRWGALRGQASPPWLNISCPTSAAGFWNRSGHVRRWSPAWQAVFSDLAKLQSQRDRPPELRAAEAGAPMPSR
jgi:hypothetical protein